ncbi:MAG: SHOCT domain-containing protein [Solirubrobacteraceae bacterium]
MLQLEHLADLRDKGLLTSSEFEAARARVAKQLIDGAS